MLLAAYWGVSLGILGSMPTDANNQETIIHCTSIFGANTKKGLVGIQIGDGPITCLEPEEARSHAEDVLQCATAAEMDEVLMAWLTNRMGVDPGQATLVLRDLRQMRDERRAAEPPVENR